MAELARVVVDYSTQMVYAGLVPIEENIDGEDVQVVEIRVERDGGVRAVAVNAYQLDEMPAGLAEMVRAAIANE